MRAEEVALRALVVLRHGRGVRLRAAQQIEWAEDPDYLLHR